MSAKLLKISFVILLLVIFGEAGYYVYVLRRSSLNTTQNSVNARTDEIQVQEIKSYVDEIKKGSIKSSILTNNYEGKITELEKNGGKLTVNGKSFEYKVKITIKPESDNEFTYYFRDFDLNLTKIKEMKDGKDVALQFSDLQIGDNVSMTIGYNLQKTDSTGITNIDILRN